ncbi:hypothetical protein BU16DRAFT_620529 [Lophium mytilinum]|uniref:Hydrophobin n=1 Tax=Lophium mytilinum TaxID=390894 RepID=A0A6A6QJC8_9PEZI|nr:hypothetical protein BU16DRAFT_620529 [Lophium mytilinum]
MRFLLILSSALSLASAAAVTPRHPANLVGGELTKRDVCGGDTSPVCCQLDVEGVADLNCQSPGDVATVAEFKNACAAEGLSAECCALVAGADGLVCSAV